MTDGFFVESGSVDGEFMSIRQEEALSLKKTKTNKHDVTKKFGRKYLKKWGSS